MRVNTLSCCRYDSTVGRLLAQRRGLRIGPGVAMRPVAVQWARHSIRVNTIAPGFFRSEITNPLYESERGLAWLRRNTPLPYTATVDDLAGAMLWLASDAGRYVTGQTIIVDGGWTAK